MKLCKSCIDTTIICDFCKHFEISDDGILSNDWCYDGMCTLHCKPCDVADDCDEFYCKLADKEEDE